MINTIFYLFFTFLLIIILIYTNNLNRESFIDDNKLDFYKNKNILILGSSKGIGFELAKKLSKYNTKIVITGKNENTLKNSLEYLSKFNDNVISITADLSYEENIDKLINESINHLKAVDIFINCVSSKKSSKNLTDLNFKDWMTDMNVNVNSILKLNQKIIKHMKSKFKNGRIINLSSYISKDRDTKRNSGSEIISKTFLERISDILADENFRKNISIATIRIDNDNNKLKGDSENLNNLINNFFGSNDENLDTIATTILDIIKLPHKELSGKLYSTSTFNDEPELSKIIPSYNLSLNKNIYPVFDYNEQNDTSNYTILTNQNPYGLSKKIKLALKNYNYNKSKFNIKTKHHNKLTNVISEKIKIKQNKIVFFKNEYLAIKKIISIFVPKYHNVFTLYPSHEYLELLSNEHKFEIKYTIFKNSSNIVQPKFEHIINYLTPKTKLIYLSSPNLITGQNILTEDFDNFLQLLPKNIIVLLDQTFWDFVSKNDKKNEHLNALKYINGNVIVLRSFNNFYGFENLELCYTLASESISKILNNSNIIENQIDNFTETMALECLNDKKHINFVKNKIYDEKKRIYKILDENEIPYYPSDANYILINTKEDKEKIYEDLRKNGILINNTNLYLDNYWPLPISTQTINDKVIDIITSNF